MRPAIQQQLPNASNPAVAAPPMQQASAPQETSVNIAILDSKDFPSEIAPIQELYSEISMMDGKILFECRELLKSTGIDLMNCPLSVVLLLRIRRRMMQGAHVLWHVVLPLPLISKNLMSPPHEWETWIGLMPNKQSLADHPPEVMFTQAVHLISRPEFPKLRLRFTYHNAQLQAQAQAQLVQQEQDALRRKQHTEQMGRAQFQDIHKLMKTVRENNDSTPSAIAKAALAMETPSPQPGPVVAQVAQIAHPSSVARGLDNSGDDALRDTFTATVTVPTPEPTPESHRLQLQAQQAGYAGAHMNTQMLPTAAPMQHAVATPHSSCSTHEAEPLLVEGVRMAIMGLLDDADGGKVPRTTTNLTTASAHIASIKEQFPNLWNAFREVSALAKERAAHIEQHQRMQEQCRYLQEQCGKLKQEKELAEQAAKEGGASKTEASKTHFEKLLKQQREALQMSFDTETKSLRQQLEEMKRTAQEKETQVSQLRGQLNQFLSSRKG